MARVRPQTETELKYSLSKTEYLKLQKHLKPWLTTKKRQDNYYFDTPDLFLKENRIGLRVRFENSKKAFSTIKFPKPNSKTQVKALKIRYEIENPISLVSAKLICRNKKTILSLNSKAILTLKQKIAKKNADRIVCLGKLRNLRTVYQYSPKHTLELDRSEFFGNIIYELEIETLNPRATDSWIKELLKQLGIRAKPESASKLQRFLLEWQKQKNRPKAKP